MHSSSLTLTTADSLCRRWKHAVLSHTALPLASRQAEMQVQGLLSRPPTFPPQGTILFQFLAFFLDVPSGSHASRFTRCLECPCICTFRMSTKQTGTRSTYLVTKKHFGKKHSLSNFQFQPDSLAGLVFSFFFLSRFPFFFRGGERDLLTRHHLT